MSAAVRISAVGDISFEGARRDVPSAQCFRDVAASWRESHVVVANLECALTGLGEGIAGKCVLRASPEWAGVIRNSGIGLVTLANNHIMDYGPQGLASTIESLQRAGIRYVGAGRNRDEACAPLFMTVAGKRVAFLARTSVAVSAPTYATESLPGVAFLDPDETLAAIRACCAQADLVVLLLHWGVEEYSYPTPGQRALARRFIDAGVDAVLGHHPHVLQGVETHRNGIIVYSLGNFVFDEFDWTYAAADGTEVHEHSPLSADNRKSIIATLEWERAGAPPALTHDFTCIDETGCARLDPAAARPKEMRRLSAGLRRALYPLRWRLYSLRREWDLRLGNQVSPRRILTNLHRIRPRHILELTGKLRRSARIVSERTSNPYE